MKDRRFFTKIKGVALRMEATPFSIFRTEGSGAIEGEWTVKTVGVNEKEFTALMIALNP